MGQAKELREAVNAMGQSAPIVTIGKGIGKVGELVQRGVDAVKRKVSGPPLPDPRIGRKLVNGKVIKKRAPSAGKSMGSKR